MKIILEYPYTSVWKSGYLVTNRENRKNVILFNSDKDRSTTSYARYLMSVKLKRFLTSDEQVDHIDNDKTNDDINNLQVLSVKENQQKAGLLKRKYKHGTLTAYRYCRCDECRLHHSLYGWLMRQ